MTFPVRCLDCDNRYEAGDALRAQCPLCGSFRWKSPPDGGIYVAQFRKPPEKVQARADAARHLREYAQALEDDDINDFYSRVVVAEMKRAARLLEGADE